MTSASRDHEKGKRPNGLLATLKGNILSVNQFLLRDAPSNFVYDALGDSLNVYLVYTCNEP